MHMALYKWTTWLSLLWSPQLPWQRTRLLLSNRAVHDTMSSPELSRAPVFLRYSSLARVSNDREEDRVANLQTIINSSTHADLSSSLESTCTRTISSPTSNWCVYHFHPYVTLIHPSIDLWIGQSFRLTASSIHPSARLDAIHSINLSIHQFTEPSIHQSVDALIHPCIGLPPTYPDLHIYSGSGGPSNFLHWEMALAVRKLNASVVSVRDRCLVRMCVCVTFQPLLSFP